MAAQGLPRASGPSRLDTNILRLAGCRDCLNHAAEIMSHVDGVIFELGLGNGRSFDHLRMLFPKRDIYVFERKVAAHPRCIPDDEHLYLGNLHETLPRAAERFRGQVALLHADIGGADKEKNLELTAYFARFVPELMKPEGLVVSSEAVPGLEPYALPEGVREGSYFMYRPRRAAA